MISVISEDGVMGYPAKKPIPAYRAPSAHASLPWINNGRVAVELLMAISRLSRRGHKRNGQIRTETLAELAEDAVLYSCNVYSPFLIRIKDLLGTKADAYTASLAPFLVYLN